jgi:hypothetical protein
MATTLELVDSNKPYKFRSLGVWTEERGQAYMRESKLFPIDSVVELTSGKFPLTDYMNLYVHSKKTHVIGGKTVRIVGMSVVESGCEIDVIEDQNGGTRRCRGGRRSTRRRCKSH